MAMRVAHLTATFFPYPSGTGRVCLQNALGAAKLGCDVTVITSAVKDESVIDDPPGLTVHRLPAAFKVGNAPLLPGLFRMAKYDIVHLHYPFVFGQEILHAVAGLRRIPVVITYHQDLILSGMMGRMVALHEKTVGRLILTRANRLLVTSRDYFNASRIARFFKPNDPRVTEMPNGVDTSRFTTDVDTAGIRSMYGFAEDDVVLAFCGGMDTPHYFKGVDVLLNAAARVDAPNLRLMLIGDGDLRARYMEEARRLGLGERAVFCGRVPDSDLPRHYAAADFLVLPSTTMGEAFGIVLLEAMAAGKPVIASNLPGVRTVVNSGVDGFLAAPNDVDDLAARIRDMLDAGDRRKVMGRAGRDKVVAKYDWSRINERLVDVYREVVDGRR
ncbi:MAG: glycosyltransferase family 1 protein [Chloroflexi bacterium]|nr:glycosyltransferase family 1 protein [Chloroflexota bacterium]RIK20627.1 MAG: glycosyltransferase family 1 protein [Chloroflexota bacterium]